MRMTTRDANTGARAAKGRIDDALLAESMRPRCSSRPTAAGAGRRRSTTNYMNTVSWGVECTLAVIGT
eukprot:4147411-Pyramimonas_sp.AAC.2